MKGIIAVLIKNLVSMLLTKKMIFWALEVATKQTSNKIDDNVVEIVKAAYLNDDAKLRKGVEGLLNDLKTD